MGNCRSLNFSLWIIFVEIWTFQRLIFLKAQDFFFFCTNLIFHWKLANSRFTHLIVEIKIFQHSNTIILQKMGKIILILSTSGLTYTPLHIYRYTNFNANLRRSREWSKLKPKTWKSTFQWKSSMSVVLIKFGT